MGRTYSGAMARQRSKRNIVRPGVLTPMGALSTQLGSCLWGKPSAPIHKSDPLLYAAISLGNRCIDIFDQEPDARRHMDHDRVAGACVTAAREDLVGVPVDAEPVTSVLDLY